MPQQNQSIPSTIGRFPVERLLGKGATGAVFLASDAVNDNRKVAIKLAFPEQLASPTDGPIYKSMFLNEAALAGKVIHPHIVSIYDAVVEDRSTYIVMEYVEGNSLEQFCRKDNLLPVQQVCEIIFKCVRALAFAHAEGLIHRDIKPANILHTGETNIKIVDFGASINLTSDRTIVANIGSPVYMAPEVLSGDAKASHRSDIYSMGVVMYLLLTARLPYSGNSPDAIMYAIEHIEPPPPSELRAGISRQLDVIVQRAISKNAADRFDSWEQFGQALVNLARDEARDRQDERENTESQRFELLRTLSFFKDFPETELWEVLRITRWGAFPPDSMLIKEGDIGDSFFVLARGSVKITRKGKLLNILSPGDCFGEMSYLSHRQTPRSATVVTTAESTVLKIRANDLRNASPECRRRFDAHFLEALVDRLQLANEQLTVST